MSDIIAEIEKAIEKAAREYVVNDAHARPEECGYDRDRRHFEQGASVILPLLKKAIEQRDYHLNHNSDTVEQYNRLLKHENSELLKLLGENYE